MRKNTGNRLIGVASLALFGFAACTIQVKDADDAGSAATTTTGGVTTGGAGSGAAGSSSGSGGTTGVAGSTGQAGSAPKDASTGVMFDDASLPGTGYKDGGWDSSDGGCINDSTDGGDMANPHLCMTLNGATSAAACYADSDAKALCNLMRQNARRGAYQVFFDCINAKTKTDPCAPVDECVDDAHWPTGCQVGKVVVSNGKTWDCTNLVAKCPATDGGDPGFTMDQCDFIMNVFNDEARTKIFNCYLFKNNDPATCADDFTSCVYNPDQ